MNEEAFNTMYTLAQKEGYEKTPEEFKTLLSSNEEALNTMYSLAQKEGYEKPVDEFKTLLGVSSGEGETGNFTNASSEPSEGATTEQSQGGTLSPSVSNNQSEVSSQPSEESGTKPSVLVEQPLPVGVASREELISNIKDPYIKRQEEILLSASNEKKKLISELPIQQERQKLLDGYQPLLQQKQQELQQSLSRGEITEEEANNQLNSYYEKANQQINQRIEKNFKLNDELRKVNDEVNEKAFRELNAVMKDKQAAIDLAYQEQIDQLSPLESMGNALFNSALMTSTIPAKTVLLGEQLAENFTVDLPIALYGLISGEEISDETKQAVRGETQSVTQQQSAYKEIKDTEEQLKPTLPFIESLEKGQIDKASAAAVGTSIDFLRSIITGAGTLGTGTFGEIGAPMYMDAVRAKAKETGKKEEDIIAEDLEDETTALLSAGLATAAEYYGLGTATKFMKNAVFKQGVKDQVKKNLPKLVELGKDVSVASLKESGTEVFQQSIEEANKAALDNGGIGTDEGRKAFLKEGINSTFTKQAAETGASTFAGSMLLFGMGKGAGSLRRTKSVIDTPTQLLSDEDIKQVLDNKDNIEVLSEQIKGMYQAGVITEEEYKVSEDKINTVLRYGSELSPTNTNREEGIRLLAKREQLENEMESLHPTQRGNIETKIAKIDEQLINIANGTGQAPQEDKGRTVRDRAQEEGSSQETQEAEPTPATEETGNVRDENLIGLEAELAALEEEVTAEETTQQAPEVKEQGMVSDGGKNYEIISIDNKKDGSKVVKAKEVIEVTEDNIDDLQSSRKAPLKIGDTVYGTTKRYKGQTAEVIAKDNAVGVFEEKAPKPKKWKTRGTPNKQKVTPTPKTFSSKAKPTIKERTPDVVEQELEEEVKQIEKETADFEQAVLDELAAKDRNRDLVSLKGNIYQVTRKPDGTFSVSKMREDGKLIGLKAETEERKAAISQFKRKQTLAEKSDMTQAEKLVEESRKESEDRILKALDKAIQDTSFARLRGQANDVVTVLGYTAANATLRGVRAAYKAGVSLKEAIAIQYDKIKGTGITELEFKKFVLDSLKTPQNATKEGNKQQDNKQQYTDAQEGGEATEAKRGDSTKQSGKETNQKGSTTKEEKVKTTAKTTTSETEGLTEKEKTKQGFIEYTEAAKQKTKEKIKSVTDLFKAKIKEVRDKVKQTSTAENELRKDLAAQVKELRVAGRLSAKDAERLTQKALTIKISRPKAIVKFKNQLQKTLDIVDYNNKVDKAKATRRKLKPRKDALAGDKSRIKKFKKIDPTKVKDLDKYNEIAEEMLASQKPSVRTDKGVKIAPIMPYAKVDEYLNEEAENQEKERIREIKEEYEFLADMDLSYEELSEIIDTLEEGKDSKLSQERKDEISRAMDTLKAFYEQDLAQKLEDGEYSKEDTEIIKKLIDADISKLFFADKVRAIRIIENILNNDSFAGVVDTLNTIDVANSKEALKGIKGIAPKIFFMRNIPISYLKQVATLTETMKALFSGNNAANAVSLESGMTDLDTGLVKKAREHKAMIDEYNKLVKNMAGYNSSVNLATRAVYGFVTRTVKGTATQVQAEFNRRKDIILEQQEFFNSDERFEKQAEVLNKVIEELGLKETNSTQDLNISENNKKIVDFFVDKFEGLYDSLSDVAEKVYNKELSEDERYTPDVHIKVDPKGDDIDLNQSLFFQDTIDTKESGMLMDTTKSKGLAKNEKGKVTRVVSLDFDSTMMRKLDEALTEINTAEHVNKVAKFISKDNLSNFMDDTSANILIDKMTSYVQSEKGIYKNSQADEVEKVAGKVIDLISNFMATKLLARVWMPVKQMIPVLIRAAVHMDTKSVGQMLTSMVGKNKEGIELAEKYGTVALRGKQSSVDIDNLSKRMSGTGMLSKKLANLLGEEKSLRAQKIVSKIGEIYEKPLEWTLEKPDVLVAKASWYGYYYSKVTEGGKEFNIEKEMQSPNKEAIQYANSMVAQTQNESQSSKMGDIFKSKTLTSKIVRNVLFPFANFVQNLRTNIYNNVRIATSKTASKEDKEQAVKGIVGAASEMIAFNIVASGTRYLTDLAIKGLLGLDDDDEDEREFSWILGIPMNAKERRIFYTNIISDLSPAPILDNVVLYTAERINQAMIEAKGKNYNRFEDSFVYAPPSLFSSETFLNSGGKFGSAYSLYTDTEMMVDMADVFVNDNTYTKTTMFGSTEKPLSAAKEADAQIALAIQTFYLLAPVTADFGSIAKTIKRDIDKSEKGGSSTPTQLKKIEIKKPKLKKPKLQAPKLKR